MVFKTIYEMIKMFVFRVAEEFIATGIEHECDWEASS